MIDEGHARCACPPGAGVSPGSRRGTGAVALTAALGLALGACGGGGATGTGPSAPRPVPPDLPALASQGPAMAGNAPVLYQGASLHVGADVAPRPGALSPVGGHGDVRVSHGRVADGEGAAELIAYLAADAENNVHDLYPDGYLQRFGSEPPTVRVAEGTTSEQLDQTVRAVQLINAALPLTWQLKLSGAPLPTSTLRPSNGEILVEFAPRARWSVPYSGNQAGHARWWSQGVSTGDPQQPWVFHIVAGRVWADHIRVTGRDRMELLVHELLHTLGRRHPDRRRFPDTIMNTPSSGPAGHVLHPLDREALLAVYGWLEPGATPASLADDLGPWETGAVHVRGDLVIGGGTVSFGVGLRNGLGQPWATGPAPLTNPQDNQQLSGSAIWSGRLLGLTPAAETVAGSAELTVDIASLDGALGFAGLESWASGAGPGAPATGSTWGTGALDYSVSVRGNAFVGTGGDDGEVTGAFFGSAHQGMGGVLRRTDLTAAFGGER